MTASFTSEAFTGPVRHLYVHVPFCTARCDYCDYFSQVVHGDGETVLDTYVEAVVAEWALESARIRVDRLETVYLGGGTPALLGAARLDRLLEPLRDSLSARAEVTVETNPDEVDDLFSDWAAERGVRVSLGVQSFSPRLRAALGRRPAADPAAAVRRLRRAGVRDLSLDLIHGIPGQTATDLDTELAAIDHLKPDHVSWYELDVVAGTPLAGRVATGDTRPDDDARAALFRCVIQGLQRRGYRWYEVSNFARPGHRARHNVACWRARPYLGLGAGAVSTVGTLRWRNAPDLDAYLVALTPTEPSCDRRHIPPRELEVLDHATSARERLMLAARCGAAVSLDDVGDVLDVAALESLTRSGLLSLHSGTIRVTRKGRHVANEVCVRLFRA